LRPVFRAELKVARARPERKDVDDLGEVGLGVETVELAGDDEREEVRGGAGVVVGAEEEPGLATGAGSVSSLPFTNGDGSAPSCGGATAFWTMLARYGFVFGSSNVAEWTSPRTRLPSGPACSSPSVLVGHCATQSSARPRFDLR
jgi:hypothetical protein